MADIHSVPLRAMIGGGEEGAVCGNEGEEDLNAGKVIANTGVIVVIVQQRLDFFVIPRPVSYHGLETYIFVFIMTKDLYCRGHPYDCTSNGLKK